MSIVDFGKSVHRRLTDLLCRRRIVFHHVPKCGGTSVGRTLRRAYTLSQGTVTPEESFKAFTAASMRNDREQSISGVLELREMMLLYLLCSDIRCISAHVPFSDVAYDQFHGKYQFVTLLRDPVERFVSHYLWSHNRPSAHGHISESFEEFLESDKARALGATYVRYFCGRPSFSVENAPVLIKAAIANLRRLNHVGFLDEMENFQKALQIITGKKLKIGKENVGKARSTHNKIIESSLRQKILDVCAPDKEIWDSVQDLRSKLPNALPARKSTLTTDSRSAPYPLSEPSGPKTI